MIFTQSIFRSILLLIHTCKKLHPQQGWLVFVACSVVQKQKAEKQLRMQIALFVFREDHVGNFCVLLVLVLTGLFHPQLDHDLHSLQQLQR